MRPGDVVAERFEVEKRAGAGGMATVYRAIDRITGQPVALKVLGGDENSDRFSREVTLLHELSHPAIVRYVAHGDTPEGERWLAMDWLEGETLARRLMRAGLTLRQSVRLGRRVAEALAVAHRRGVVHRDVKPSNLFLPDSDLERVVLLDFGVAHVSLGSTFTGVMVGTPGYMAPEQARGDADIDASADVFSLGCVLFECVTGRAAFAGDHAMALLAKILLEDVPRISSFRRDAPPELEALLMRAMNKQALERPRDGAAFAEELMAFGEISAALPAPSAVRGAVLTGNENRFLSVVLAAANEPPPGDDMPTIAGSPPVRERPAKALRTLREALRGSRVEKLADGSVMVVLSGNTVATVATDMASQAARAALAMRKRLPHAPIAIASGRGELAEGSMGEVLERAAKLVGGPAIRLDQLTAGLLDARFDVGGDAGGLLLRGEREVGKARRTLLGKATPFVGRGRELAILEGVCAESASESVARAVLVTAPAGVGKTRLFQELMAKLSGGQVWIGRGDPMKVGSPFGLCGTMVARAAGLVDGEPLEVRQQKLRARVARNIAAGEVARVAAYIGELCGVPFSVEEHASLRAARREPMLKNEQMRQAWEEWLAAECAAGPVLLAIEDLHWGDLPSVTLIDGALRALKNRPLVALALARPEVHELFPKLWAERGVTELRLGELTDRAAEKLVTEVLGAVPAATMQQLIAQAAGNAFYLEESIRALADGRDRLPETVLAMLEARLERLPPEARRVLRAASVFGQVFWKGGVEALLGLQEPTEWIDELVRRELVFPRSESRFPGAVELVFQHALVREAAYAMLTDADRQLGHRLAGGWLERVGERNAVTLAEHFQRGAEPARAAAFFAQAAQQALEGNDLAAALARAESGTACGADADLAGRVELVRAEAHIWRGEYSAAEAAGLAAMRTLPRGSPEWHRAAEQVAEASSRLDHKPLLVALGEELRDLNSRELARGKITAPQMVATARTVSQLILQGELALGAELLSRVVPVLDSFPEDPAATAWGYDAQAVLALYSGDLGGYLVGKERVVALCAKAGEPRSECLQRVRLGYACLELGDYARSVVELRGALAQAEAIGVNQATALGKHNLGLALARQGAISEGRELEEEAMQIFAKQGDVRLENASRLYLAVIHALAGNFAEAERICGEALAVISEPSPMRAYAFAVLADVQLQSGRPARASADQAMQLLESLGGVDEGEALIRLVWAEALHLDKDPRALPAIVRAEERLRERAAKIGDASLRELFLTALPENARTLAHAVSWRAG
jgi:eukaryotic-like serine/threonine-protein kinase